MVGMFAISSRTNHACVTNEQYPWCEHLDEGRLYVVKEWQQGRTCD